MRFDPNAQSSGQWELNREPCNSECNALTHQVTLLKKVGPGAQKKNETWSSWIGKPVPLGLCSIEDSLSLKAWVRQVEIMGEHSILSMSLKLV